MAAQRTAVDFPLPSNPKAPRWDGKEDTLQDFLDQFNQLATHYNADNADKKRLIPRYVPPSVKRLLESCPELTSVYAPAMAQTATTQAVAAQNTWQELEDVFKGFYDLTQSTQRYSEDDILRVADQLKDLGDIKGIADYWEWLRRFMTVGSWLVKENKITIAVLERAWWKSFPKESCGKMRHYIVLANPAIDKSIPFDMTTINTAATRAWNPYRFGEEEQITNAWEVETEDRKWRKEESDDDNEENLIKAFKSEKKKRLEKLARQLATLPEEAPKKKLNYPPSRPPA